MGIPQKENYKNTKVFDRIEGVAGRGSGNFLPIIWQVTMLASLQNVTL
jgi:hypothetical protein